MIKDRTKTTRFMLTTFMGSILLTFVVWLILPSNTPLGVLIIPFLWFMHTRLMSERFSQLYEMVDLNNELLAEILERDPTFNIKDFIEEQDDITDEQA